MAEKIPWGASRNDRGTEKKEGVMGCWGGDRNEERKGKRKDEEKECVLQLY